MTFRSARGRRVESRQERPLHGSERREEPSPQSWHLLVAMTRRDKVGVEIYLMEYCVNIVWLFFLAKSVFSPAVDCISLLSQNGNGNGSRITSIGFPLALSASQIPSHTSRLPTPRSQPTQCASAQPHHILHNFLSGDHSRVRHTTAKQQQKAALSKAERLPHLRPPREPRRRTRRNPHLHRPNPANPKIAPTPPSTNVPHAQPRSRPLLHLQHSASQTPHPPHSHVPRLVRTRDRSWMGHWCHGQGGEYGVHGGGRDGDWGAL